MWSSVSRFIKRFAGQDGQGLAEYSLILAFIAIVCVASVTLLGLAILGPLDDIVAGF